MKTELNITCPVSAGRTDENIVRAVAFLTVIIAAFVLITNNYLLSIFLIVDFTLRGLDFGKYSVLRFISKNIVETLNIKPKPIDSAPKLFAAKIGIVFALLIFIAQISNLYVLFVCASLVLLACALLESVFGICLGCYFYAILNKLIPGKNH
ncbi:MAG: DUF4395 domain-containing protein [Bacteroidetes bacterium]|nr:DUF4395 domain-containing protein [Bacteroidota bacterium]